MKIQQIGYLLILTILSFLTQDLKCQSFKEDIFLTIDKPVRTFSLRANGITENFVRIPEGEFNMGSDEKQDEQPVHTVSVKSFDMSATEITVGQFRAFIQATGYITDAESDGHSFACCWRPRLGTTWRNPGFTQVDNEPVVTISWNDAMAFCRWLSRETGRYIRLPSEGEWVEKITNDPEIKVRSELNAGFPVIVYFDDILSIRIVKNGHAVVFDGIANDKEITYIHVNFGWAGICDGWYNLRDIARERELLYIFSIRP